MLHGHQGRLWGRPTGVDPPPCQHVKHVVAHSLHPAAGLSRSWCNAVVRPPSLWPAYSQRQPPQQPCSCTRGHQDGAEASSFLTRRSITTLHQLQQLLQHHTGPLDHGSAGRASILVLRLLHKAERGEWLKRRDRRRAMWLTQPPHASKAGNTAVGPSAASSTPPSSSTAPLDTTQDTDTPSDLASDLATAKEQACQILHRVLELVEPLGACTDAMAAAHLVQALGAAGYQPVPTAQVTALLSAVEQQLPTMQSDWLAKLLWGLGKLGHSPSKRWMQTAIDVCASRSDQFGAATSVRLLEGLAGLPSHGPYPGSLLLDVTRMLQQKLDWLTPGQQVATLHALALLEFTPRAGWLDLWIQCSSSKLPGLDMPLSATLAETLWRMQFTPPSWWVTKYLKYSEQAIRDATPGNVLETATWLMRLHVEPSRPWLHHALTKIRGLPPPTPQSRARAPYVKGSARHDDSDAAIAQAVRMAGQAATGSVQAQQPGPPGGVPRVVQPSPGAAGVAAVAARGGQDEGAQVKSVVAASALPPLRPVEPELTPWQAVQAVYVVAKCRNSPAVTPHVTWATGVLTRLLTHLPAVSTNTWPSSAAQDAALVDPVQSQQQQEQQQQPGGVQGPNQQGVPPAGLPDQVVLPKQAAEQHAQRLVDVLYACAELQYLPNIPARAQLLDGLLAQLQPYLAHTTPPQAATIMVCLAVLRLRPTPAWRHVFFTHMHAQLPAFSAQVLANTLTGSAFLQLDPGEAVCSRVVELIPSFDLVQLAMLVRKLEGARLAQPPAWLQALKQAVKKQFSSRS